MLCLPDTGFQPSTETHNVKLDVLVDWIEGSVTFTDEKLSRTDVVDVLCENNIYHEQDLAHELVTDAWSELERRSQSMLDGSPFLVDGRRITRRHAWEDNPSYSFCLFLTLQVLFKKWAKQFRQDFTRQGILFEKLTCECLHELGWSVHHTGWTPGNMSRIGEIVSDVCLHLGEPEIPGEVEKWTSEAANDEGLDVVCSDPFYDGRGAYPVYLLQCASGANWTDKLHTPNPDTWRRIISFTAAPQRGFSMPFGLLDEKFRRMAGKVNGMFLDRFRLQSPSVDGNVDWLSKPLRSEILQWMRPRVRKLPDDRH